MIKKTKIKRVVKKNPINYFNNLKIYIVFKINK
jgi:hypothetical protein